MAFHTDMLRTQIQLTKEQHRRLRAEAQREGVSIAEVIRRAVVRYFEEGVPDRHELYERASDLVGKFKDLQDATDVSERHDDYLDEAYR